MNDSYTHEIRCDIKKNLVLNSHKKLSASLNTSMMFKNKLRQKFIEHGHIINPELGHRVEYNFNNMNDANDTIKELLFFGIDSKISINKNNRYVVYILDGKTIVNFLKIIASNKYAKEYNAFLTNKSNIKKVQCQVNFETANIKKAAIASKKQIDDIDKFLKIKKFEELDETLQKIIKYRKKYPYMSLTELAHEIGDISKNTINHKFMKIREFIKE